MAPQPNEPQPNEPQRNEPQPTDPAAAVSASNQPGAGQPTADQPSAESLTGHWDEIFRVDAAISAPEAAASDATPVNRRALRENAGPLAADRRPRRSRRQSDGRDASGGPPKSPQKGWIVALIIVVLLLGSAVGVASWAWANYEDQIRTVMGWEIPIDYEGSGHGEATVIIRSGDGGEAISASLAEAGVTKTPEAFYKLLLKQEPQVVFFPGHYLLKQEMSAQAALEALQDPANKVEISVLIKEGWSVEHAIDALAEGTGIPVEDFEAAIADPTDYGVPASATNLEGYLFPARYTFGPDADAVGIIERLVERTYQSLDAAGVEETDRHRVLTIASMIQREAGSNPDNFYKVSRVIQNRLAQNMKLQFDSTAHYGYAWAHGEREDESVFSSRAELNDPNPYNTYVHTGLPPGPIGAAGDLAIDAAINPVPGTWIFFATVNLETGETKFSTTLAEHNAAVEELRTWCRTTKSPNCD